MAEQITQEITPLPAAPAEGAGFRARAAAYLTALVTFATQLITWRSQVNAVAVSIKADAISATAAMSSVSASAVAAQSASATAVAALDQVVAAVNANIIYPPQLVTSFFNPASGLPPAPVIGQAHVATATANGWTTGKIYKRGSAAWTEYTPATGWLVLDVSSPSYWVWSGSVWMRRLTAADVSIGTDPDQVPTNGMLGTNAYLDRTYIYKSTTWDAPLCANAAQVSTSMTVEGAEVGDDVDIRSGIPLQGLNLRGEVTATNTVTIYLSNMTGGAVDLASAAYYVKIDKHIPTR